MSENTKPLHKKEREILAKGLGLSFAKFDLLVDSANKAYEIIKELGPFYGREENKEPTFRIPAEPVTLPSGSKRTLEILGDDLLHLAKALQSLSSNQKEKLAEDLDFRIPPSFRIDVIVDEKGNLKVNEIEGQDGASALMIAEQIAYGIQTLEQSTAAKFATTLRKICNPQDTECCKVVHIRVDNQHNTNADRFIEFVRRVSNGKVHIDHISENDVVEGNLKPKWDIYDGAIVETSHSPKKFYALDLNTNMVISTGVNNAFVNKGVFALFFEEELEQFWKESLGKDRFVRLQKILIPSRFVNTIEDLKKARNDGKVVKVSWAGEKAHLINRSKGVAIPDSSVDQGSDERWQTLEDLLGEGVKMIAQDFIVPGKFKSYLRKKGITLEYVDWYNRVCVKYVVEGNPNDVNLPAVALTATEVTLGPEVVPAGRKCAFTAGVLK